MEKTLRVLGGNEDHAHGHSHSHSVAPEAHSSGVSISNTTSELKARKSSKGEAQEGTRADDNVQAKPAAQSSKLSAYLNLFGDFVHNM